MLHCKDLAWIVSANVALMLRCKGVAWIVSADVAVKMQRGAEALIFCCKNVAWIVSGECPRSETNTRTSTGNY